MKEEETTTAATVKIEKQDDTVQVIETQKVIDINQRKRKRNPTSSSPSPASSMTVRRSTRIKRT